MGCLADPHPSACPSTPTTQPWSYCQAYLVAVGAHGQGGEEVNSMVEWKNMQFWRQQQQLPRKQFVTHASGFNPEADVERAIETIAGTNWGEAEVAQDRGRWQDLSAVSVERYDVPWATGKQLTIQDKLLPNHRRGPPAVGALTTE